MDHVHGRGLLDLQAPLQASAVFKQMEFIGVKSLWVVIVTGGFTGMVLALQTYYRLSLAVRICQAPRAPPSPSA